jgi:hypothetical protein
MGVVQRSRSSEIPLFISPPDHGVSPATARGDNLSDFDHALGEVRARKGRGLGSRGARVERFYVWRPLRQVRSFLSLVGSRGSVASARARRVSGITASVRPPSRVGYQEGTRSARMTAWGRVAGGDEYRMHPRRQLRTNWSASDCTGHASADGAAACGPPRLRTGCRGSRVGESSRRPSPRTITRARSCGSPILPTEPLAPSKSTPPSRRL